MQLPAELRDALEREAFPLSLSALAGAAASLSASYRTGVGRTNVSDLESVAYALVRFPATYAAAASALVELDELESLLDLGAGSGAAGWAAVSTWPELKKITFLEREPSLVALGKRLAAASSSDVLSAAKWRTGNILAGPLPPHDAVILSYSLGELPEPLRLRAVDAAWTAAQNALILIEPGTTDGFSLIRAARSRLIEAGAHIAAPCPHEKACPIPAGDWCHFAARLERTALHRKLKGAAMSYEDEKFSYVIACREPWEAARSRIIRRPRQGRGLIELMLCTPQGLEQRKITKREPEAWRTARKAFWGGRWES